MQVRWFRKKKYDVYSVREITLLIDVGFHVNAENQTSKRLINTEDKLPALNATQIKQGTIIEVS